MTDLLEVEQIAKAYPTGRTLLGRPSSVSRVVDDVSFVVARAETVALVGESGAGKSTVGGIVAGLIDADSGRVCFDGQNVLAFGRKQLASHRSRVRFIFQDPFSSLDPRLVVGAAINEPLRFLTSMDRRARERTVAELFERVGLHENYVDRYPYEFSGGQLQRIAVARAIATSPDLVVCDEPVAALDMSTRAQIIKLLVDLQAERGIAYLFISHDLSLVRVIADRVLVMYMGRIVEAGDCETVFEEAAHPYTRALLSAIPVPDPSRRRTRPKVPWKATVAVRTGQSVGCAYASLCPFAMEVCWAETPPLIEYSQHSVACHLGISPMHAKGSPAQVIPRRSH